MKTNIIIVVIIIFSFIAVSLKSNQHDRSSKQTFNLMSSTEIIYLDISEIFPAQLRYSSQNVKQKIENNIEQGKANWNKAQACWQIDNIPTKNALPVVKAPFGYVLVDGHHDMLAYLALKAKQVPVRIVSNLSKISEEEFWEEAEKKGFAYLYDIHGNRKIPPRDILQLQDDPNRFFAALSARKYPDPQNLKISFGADYPLWIKIGKDIPFIEFQIADVLWKNGLIYQYQMGNDFSKEFAEKARQILFEAKIPGLRIVTERVHYSKLDIQ